MSAWDDSHWVDYDAQILNVFTGGESSWIDFRYSIGYVGWRALLADTPAQLTNLVNVASAAKQGGWTVRLRVTNPGQITAIQTS